MQKRASGDATTRLLLAVEWSVIIAGFAATVAVLVSSYAAKPAHRRDPVSPAVAAKSACDGGTGARATLRAWLDGAELLADPSAPAPPIDDALRARGGELFATYCTTCHGERGDGRGPTAAQLAHPPANFTLGTYELRTTEHEALPADADLFRTITRGVHGTAMPPWFALPERDRWALVAHLKTLSKEFSDDEAPAPVDTSHVPEVTSERITRGRHLYESSGCASCHGGSGRGNGPAASALFYASGKPARPRDLRIGRFHRGTRLADIYLTLATGLDGTPMASFAKMLPPDDLWDVAMFVQDLSPPITQTATGVRCPEIPDSVRCIELPEGITCPEPVMNPDELVGARWLMSSLHLSR
jgi:cytochrome c oxidase cbb3-type subunit 2